MGRKGVVFICDHIDWFLVVYVTFKSISLVDLEISSEVMAIEQ